MHCPFHCSCYIGYNLAHRKGNNSLKNSTKKCNLIVKSVMCKTFIVVIID